MSVFVSIHLLFKNIYIYIETEACTCNLATQELEPGNPNMSLSQQKH
jgi:hypothetical protein